MRETERRASERGRKSNEKGRAFHEGQARERGETEAAGWQHEKTTNTSLGGRRHDTVRRDKDGRVRDFTEYKNRHRLESDAFFQLQKDREILERDERARGTWVIRDDARMDERTRTAMERMRRDFPDRFKVERVNREQVRDAVRAGEKIERERGREQLELHDVERLRQADRERKRQRTQERADRVRAQAQARETAERERKEAEQAERTRVLRARTDAIHDREREFRAAMPGAPDDVISTLARSGQLPGDAARASREAAERATRAGRDAERQRERDDRGRGRDR
ncbi:hypothetical protein ACFXHA_45295 [Nocardia sp. NPDC059240]|uniref:hypothetical protein n=1 Tax=Nocardia sp. NPDC059240 TaxID=3346786 RepID=UPI0036A3F624